MSLRQAARLRRARGIGDAGLGLKELLEENNDDEEESSTEESPRHSSSSLVFARAAMGWSSESPSEDDNDNEGEDEEYHTPTEPCTEDIPQQHTSQRRSKKKRGGGSKVNMQEKYMIQKTDDEILDCVIADIEHSDEAKMTAEGDRLPTVINPLPCLRTDSKFLNVDSELRSRFGRGVLRAGRDEPVRPQYPIINNRQHERGANQRLSLKRVLVGHPESGFTTGGLGVEPMTSLPPNTADHSTTTVNKGATWFIFRRSAAYAKLCDKFTIIQQSMDPNLLAVFVSSSPHHAEALLELALVRAHSKLMDKAGRLVRRCIYAFEAPSSEAFRSAALSGQARLDVNVPSNYTYMRSLFEHMRLCDMRGCHRTALEISRLLLSLDPLNDPMGALLYVDSFALKAGAFKVTVQLSESPLSKLNLPGIAFSCCLSHARLENQAEALLSMKSALSRFPFMLEPLLDVAGIPSPRQATFPHDWKSIFISPLFLKYKAPPLAVHLANIYAICAGDVWSSDIAKDLLYDGASLAIQMGHDASIAAESVFIQSYKDNSNSPLKRYLRYQIKDFRTPYPEFPEQVSCRHWNLDLACHILYNVVDVSIIDAAEHGPIRMVGGIDPIDAAEELLLQHRRPPPVAQIRGGLGWGNQNNLRNTAQEGTVLDLNLPLAELFWRSFLPWSTLPSS